LPNEIDDAEDLWNVPIEFTAPDPPDLSGASGLKTVVEAVSGLNSVGIMASPRQSFDVHLMLKDGAGPDWTDQDIAMFFVGYARAQYALDFVVPSNRVGQHGGAGLYLWDPKVQYMFRNLHRLMRNATAARISEPQWLCDAILGQGECDSTSPYWPSKHTPLRHYAVNFAKVASWHSLELRGFGAATDPELIARWVDLTLRMASSFRQDKSLLVFFDEDEETDLKQLHAAQESKSLTQLFDEVGLPKSSRDFYSRQSWAKIGPGGSWGPRCVDDLTHHKRHPKRQRQGQLGVGRIGLEVKPQSFLGVSDVDRPNATALH
jgi:hypothetical protein